MTTPAINTPYGIITDAMRDAGLLQIGDTPGTEHLVENMRRLRDLINTAQIDGIKLWLLSDTAVPLMAGTGTYTFSPGGSVNMTKPLRVDDGYYLYSTGVRRPIYAISWEEYIRLGQANQEGTITQYFVDKQATTMRVIFWNVPDATEAAGGEAHVLLRTQVTNPSTLTETMAFPEEWRMYLRWGLADDICTGQPETIMMRCAQKAFMYKTALENWDVEDASVKFAPDSRQSGYGTGGFR